MPTTGAHLPAALLHDGLRHGQDEDPTFTAPEWHGPPILRVEANRVLRDAMADTGTGVERRWLVWSAVATATMLQGRAPPGRQSRGCATAPRPGARSR